MSYVQYNSSLFYTYVLGYLAIVAMLLLEHILLYQEKLKDFKLLYKMSGLRIQRFLEKIFFLKFLHFTHKGFLRTFSML